MLFLDEVQSDWNSEIREKGVKIERPAVIQNEINRLFDERTTLRQNFWKSYNALEFAPLDVRDRTDKKALTEEMLASKKGKQFTKKIDNIEAKIAELTEKHPTNPAGEPDMPYKGSKWQDLVMKRMIRWAADNGYDRLGWITGKDTADRYDLSKVVSEVLYNEKTQTLLALDKEGNDVLFQEGIPADKVADYIGKEPAEKLLKQPVVTLDFKVNKDNKDFAGRPYRLEKKDSPAIISRHATAEDAWAAAEKLSSTRQLKGQDLRVGGEWASNLYDKSLPKIARKLTKKKGAVGRVGIYGSNGKLNGALAKNGIKPKYEANYVDISPEVKGLAQEGFSYFMPEGRGGAASAPVQTAAPQPPSGVIIPKVKLTEEEKEESRQLLQQLLD
jgi:hypothetical protein